MSCVSSSRFAFDEFCGEADVVLVIDVDEDEEDETGAERDGPSISSVMVESVFSIFRAGVGVGVELDFDLNLEPGVELGLDLVGVGVRMGISTSTSIFFLRGVVVAVEWCAAGTGTETDPEAAFE